MNSCNRIFKDERNYTYKRILEKYLRNDYNNAYDVWAEFNKYGVTFIMARQVTQNIKNRIHTIAYIDWII